MTPKEYRERLWKRGRPKIRKLELMDGEQYSLDVGILWAAYQKGAFQKFPRDISQEEFLSSIQAHAESAEVWLIEDSSKAFQAGNGPVCLAMTIRDGLVVSATGETFPWAQKRGLLRCAVAFLWMLIHSSKVGLIFVKVPRKLRGACNHMKKYGVLHYVGKMDDDIYLYAVRGRGSD